MQICVEKFLLSGVLFCVEKWFKLKNGCTTDELGTKQNEAIYLSIYLSIYLTKRHSSLFLHRSGSKFLVVIKKQEMLKSQAPPRMKLTDIKYQCGCDGCSRSVRRSVHRHCDTLPRYSSSMQWTVTAATLTANDSPLWGPHSFLFSGHRAYLPGIKRSELEVDLSPPCSTEVNN
jgi:hypothetical protein